MRHMAEWIFIYGWLPVSNRLRYLPFLIIVLVNMTAVPGQLSEIKRHWPVIRLWNDPAAQMSLMLGDVPYEGLKMAAETTAPDVTILLITSGEDVRRRDYTTYHRALYLLAPRPVWWLSPAPPDGTWESRWWISKPISAENIAATVTEKTADCLLLIDVPPLPEYGELVKASDEAAIVQTGLKDCLSPTPTSLVNYPTSFWPLGMVMALFVIFAYGLGLLALAERVGGRISSLEKITLAWLLGAGLLSTCMFWLDRLAFSLEDQLIVLTVGAGLLLLWQRQFVAQLWASARKVFPAFKLDYHPLQKTAVLLIAVFLTFQLTFVVLMVIGRPLTIWDSWVNWGSKGRMIFLENGITPALYADSSRSVMLLGYPLSIPLLEAWLYGWLGAADDRLVGILFVMTYLALGGFVFGFCRRRGIKGFDALLVMVVALSLGHIVGLTATAFTDLWLSVLSAVAAVYLVEWLEGGKGGYLVLSAVAAGLLPWFKQEGLILVLIMLTSLLLTWFFSLRTSGWPISRMLITCGIIGLTAVIFGGPWRLFASREAALVSVFLPLTVDNLLANVARLPVILLFIARELVSFRTGLVWVVMAAVLLVLRSQWDQVLKRPILLCLLIPALYLAIMSMPYLFSDFVPYQQHILSSFFRINAHVLLLLFLGGARILIR